MSCVPTICPDFVLSVPSASPCTPASSCPEWTLKTIWTELNVTSKWSCGGDQKHVMFTCYCRLAWEGGRGRGVCCTHYLSVVEIYILNKWGIKHVSIYLCIKRISTRNTHFSCNEPGHVLTHCPLRHILPNQPSHSINSPVLKTMTHGLLPAFL